MTANTQILMYGLDPQLLTTRAWVFQASGFQVTLLTTFNDPAPLLARGQTDLLVLCHTLPVPECQAAQRLAEAQAPPVRCLVLDAGDLSCPLTPGTESVRIAAGPGNLLSTVTTLVESPSVTHNHLL